jgi:hypothetical protein
MRICEKHRLDGCNVPDDKCIGCVLDETRDVVEDARSLLREYLPGRFAEWHARAEAVRHK